MESVKMPPDPPPLGTPMPSLPFPFPLSFTNFMQRLSIYLIMRGDPDSPAKKHTFSNEVLAQIASAIIDN